MSDAKFALRGDVAATSSSGFTIQVRDEPVVDGGSSDPLLPYARVYSLGESLVLTFRHGVLSFQGNRLLASLLLESVGPSGVNIRSLLILGDTAYVVVGPHIVALSIPTLEVIWSTPADDAQCFGIHPGPDERSLISHGELEIARLSLSGEILWRTAGADIFTGSIEFSPHVVKVRDFKDDLYLIDMETGSCTGGPT
jgi:hypothetical protein